LRRALIAASLFAAIAAVGIGAAICFTLPPARLALAKPWDDGTIPAVLHVHTNRSDGRSSPDEVAAAASRAGLKVLVFTDHGDGTRTPDRPAYRSGVLCLDAVEISTTGGHVVAIGMPPAPYPLAGEPRDVIEDVKRLGGFAIAAHPDSPKPELRWRDWTTTIDGVEVLNPDTSWRQWKQAPGWRPKAKLAEAFAAYLVRPAEAITSLLQRSKVLEAVDWPSLAARRLVLLAGTDAHGQLALRGGDPAETRLSLPLPSYEASFRMLSIHIRPDRLLSGDAPADAAVVVRALRAGHLYTVIDGIASPPAFELTATNTHGTVREGDVIGAGGPLTLRVRSNAPPDFTTAVFEGDRLVQANQANQVNQLQTDQPAGEFTLQLPEGSAVYRVEVWPPRPNQAAWITSNPIYVRAADGAAGSTMRSQPVGAPSQTPQAPAITPLFDGKSTAGWQVEHGPGSDATVEAVPVTTGGETMPATSSTELRFGFELAGRPRWNQSAALVYELPAGMTPSDRIVFRIRADRAMRVSIQFRGPGALEARRWQRSVYVDAIERERTVSLVDLTPVGNTTPPHPVPAEIRTLLFVVDTTNTRPGSAGRLSIQRVELER
jgi:hypothetical protein